MTTAQLRLIEGIQNVKKVTNRLILEREAESEGMLQAVLADQSCFFLGNSGTAKSKHIVTLSQLLGLTSFNILLSDATKPEAIFGPPDIPALAQHGIQRTKIKGYAPEAHILFFDELFRASGTVLNPLLWLINEKLYRNGDDGVTNCPIRAVFAASNDVPTTDPTLEAIYDRLLIRFKVDYIRSKRNLHRMVENHLSTSDVNLEPILSLKQVDNLREMRQEVTVTEEIKEAVFKLRDMITRSCQTTISDRRLANSFQVIQANALLHGRKTADRQDLEPLCNTFWTKPEHIAKVHGMVLAQASAESTDLLSYQEMAEDIWNNAVVTGDMEGAKTKLREIYRTTRTFTTRAGIKVRRKVYEFYDQAKQVVNQRGDFVVIEMEREGSKIFKLTMASSAVWTPQQLRSVGFRWKRTGHWWHPGPTKGQTTKTWRQLFEAKVQKTLGVEPNIKRLMGK